MLKWLKNGELIMATNVFDYALEFEKDSENYYRDLAGKTKQSGLKKILLMLAEEEVKHYKKVEELSKNVKIDISDSQILMNAVSIFTEIKKNKLSVDDVKTSQAELYRKAQVFEKDSEKFYTDRANESDDPETKGILLHLAKQEHNHFVLLENIIQFISRPDQWIEDAEFNHMTEY